jgi:hypothetical protein
MWHSHEVSNILHWLPTTPIVEVEIADVSVRETVLGYVEVWGGAANLKMMSCSLLIAGINDKPIANLMDLEASAMIFTQHISITQYCNDQSLRATKCSRPISTDN